MNIDWQSILNELVNKPSISYSEGHTFKKEVERQLVKYLEDFSPEIGMPTRVKCASGSTFYDIDINISIKGKGLFANRGEIWGECKWNNNSPVRLSDIQKLVNRAQDAFRYVMEFGGFYYDTLIMVSNQEFDINAISYANALDVLCLRSCQGQLITRNAPMNWIGYPAWMKKENYLQAF
jgi:hypothetical protein